MSPDEPSPAPERQPGNPFPEADRGHEPTEVRQHRQQLIRIALDVIPRHLGLRRQVGESSLWSAWTSFEKHLADGEFGDARSLEDLAAQLARIALNRRRRNERREKQMRGQLRRPLDPGGQPTPFEPPDAAPGPPEEAAKREDIAILERLIDQVKQGLEGRFAPSIIRLYLDGTARDQAEIARTVGCSRATVSRWIERFHDRVRDLGRHGQSA
jgi:DNA-directed RNA polymerase specialized sigma24 family protein